MSSTSSSEARQPVAAVAMVAELADNAVTAKAGASAHCRSAEVDVVDRLTDVATVVVPKQASKTHAPARQVSLQEGGWVSEPPSPPAPPAWPPLFPPSPPAPPAPPSPPE